MSTTHERPGAFDVGESPELFKDPAIFLSASVPYLKKPAGQHPRFSEADYRRWVENSDEGLIRDFVSYLCRFAFGRNVSLIFGGHPAITPMVLESARLFGNQEPDNVIVFQSLEFWDVIPQETFQMADWRLGRALWTAQRADRAESLTHMRRTMVRSPNLVAAVFVGGMDGLHEEEELWRELHPGQPSFAIGSTGGYSKELLATGRCHGERADRTTLDGVASYPMVLGRIFDDLAPALAAAERGGP